MAKGEKPILSVRIDAELLERLDKLAERAEVGRAEVVERCIALGLANQKEMVEWLESPIKGPLTQLFTHPVFLKVLSTVLRDEIDDTSMKIRNKTVEAKRSRGTKRPATA